MASTSHSLSKDRSITVSSLLSPPEMKRTESFSSPSGASAMSRTPRSSFHSDPPAYSKPKMASKTDGGAYASPPISPFYQASNKAGVDATPDGVTIRDPQLFPSGDAGTAISPDMPLFHTDPLPLEAHALVHEHMSKNDDKFRDPAMKPAKAEYLLAMSVVSTVWKTYSQDPLAWRKQEQAFNATYGSATSRNKRPLKRLAPAPYPGTANRVVKPAARVAQRVPRVPRPPKRTPPTKVYDSFDQFATPSPKPPRAPTNRDDVDYHLLPDYAPSINTLPKGNTKVLKADWKGQILDLSTDPDRNLLHEAEVNLAATLRLSCATYLCSKRRIFQARIEALRIGKEFRKTDAQQACKIDVNKASKLHTAFEKVGWFDRKHFESHLHA